MKFLLARIIGNSLPPRHNSGQTVDNLRFLLENEPTEKCFKKVFIVNRIFNLSERNEVLELLREFDAEYVEIPFSLSEYKKVSISEDELLVNRLAKPSAYSRSLANDIERIDQIESVAKNRKKIIYAMNNNGARNFVIRKYRNDYNWVLPLDGNCYFQNSSLEVLKNELLNSDTLDKCFVLPMFRLGNNINPLTAVHSSLTPCEPQLIFGSKTKFLFDEDRPYGRRPKVDLLMRLGVPGAWDNWEYPPWEKHSDLESVYRGKFSYSKSWVFRLKSGEDCQEIGKEPWVSRAKARDSAILRVLAELDQR
ncbi:hypothetical protein [Reinekea marinisedimentorum]|uniref:Uncharacterized protein n=1 Tax=Reinekea marinisedimentorum TaxID=230495 RepID=A0A4R3HX10_9GAMM|nr:hypothetical protein [Reinekea marinisedimentorum]TCS36695.1 hypothetical protein BCF53_12317 [Reinekea marinisedimentorum]